MDNEQELQGNNASSTMLEEAQQLLNNRMKFVNSLIENEKIVQDLSEQLEEAIKQQKVSWREALKAGWTEAELKKVGIKDPIKKRTRAKKNQQVNPAASETTTAKISDEMTG